MQPISDTFASDPISKPIQLRDFLYGAVPLVITYESTVYGVRYIASSTINALYRMRADRALFNGDHLSLAK